MKKTSMTVEEYKNDKILNTTEIQYVPTVCTL